MILAVLSALSELTRFKAIRLRCDGTEHNVCELVDALGTTQSRISRHMQVLKQVGRMVGRREAQWVRYRLNPDFKPELAIVIDAALAAEGKSERKVA